VPRTDCLISDPGDLPQVRENPKTEIPTPH
jgi:hypothetical protein